MRTFRESVREALQDPPRRPVSLSIETDPLPAAAWQELQNTIVIGTLDGFASGEEQRRAAAMFPSTRIVEGDHLLIFGQPNVVADVIATTLEVLRREAGEPSQ